MSRPQIDNSPNFSLFFLRSYQRDYIKSCLNAFRGRGKRRLAINLVTGGGEFGNISSLPIYFKQIDDK